MLTALMLCWLTFNPTDCTSMETLPEGVIDLADRPTDAVMLHRPDGSPLWVNPHAVAFIRPPLASEGGHSTIVFTNGVHQQVLETTEQIKAIVEQKQ